MSKFDQHIFCLPFNKSPKIIVQVLVINMYKKAKLFPAQQGVSKHYTSQILFIKKIWATTTTVNLHLEFISKDTTTKSEEQENIKNIELHLPTI